jgi:hypothetical protein
MYNCLSNLSCRCVAVVRGCHRLPSCSLSQYCSSKASLYKKVTFLPGSAEALLFLFLGAIFIVTMLLISPVTQDKEREETQRKETYQMET